MYNKKYTFTYLFFTSYFMGLFRGLKGEKSVLNNDERGREINNLTNLDRETVA